MTDKFAYTEKYYNHSAHCDQCKAVDSGVADAKRCSKGESLHNIAVEMAKPPPPRKKKPRAWG